MYSLAPRTAKSSLPSLLKSADLDLVAGLGDAVGVRREVAAVAVVEDHAHRGLGVGVRHDEVLVAVVVEVALGQVHRGDEGVVADRRGSNVPSPWPLRTLMVPTLMVFDVARSRLPSWSKSPTTRLMLLPGTRVSMRVWRVPSPLPSKTLAAAADSPTPWRRRACRRC